MTPDDDNGRWMSGRTDMKDTNRQHGVPAGGAAAVFASALAVIVIAIMPALVLAAAPPNRAAARENPRFASLQIEIWPEFDRLGAALVILKGELPAALALPAAVSLRIPASSGGPSAAAFSASASAKLFNLAYERTDGDGFVTLRFTAPERFVHVEFYDPLVTDKDERSYAYVWPGDVAVDRLSARLQEPAGASDILVQPDLGAGAEGPNGLLYRAAELGARDAGKQLPVRIRYTKRNSRTSAEILGLGAQSTAPPVTTTAGEGLPGWILGLASALALSSGAAGGVLWWRRRKKASATQPGGTGFCSQCGNRLTSGDRFCSTCGAAVRGK